MRSSINSSRITSYNVCYTKLLRIDLAVICAILSSDIDRAIHKGICFAGEVGLSGEIRPATRLNQRISEAEKLGFNKIFVPEFSTPVEAKKIQVVQVTKVEQVFKQLFQ